MTSKTDISAKNCEKTPWQAIVLKALAYIIGLVLAGVGTVSATMTNGKPNKLKITNIQSSKSHTKNKWMKALSLQLANFIRRGMSLCFAWLPSLLRQHMAIRQASGRQPLTDYGRRCPATLALAGAGSFGMDSDGAYRNSFFRPACRTDDERSEPTTRPRNFINGTKRPWCNIFDFTGT